MPSISVKDGTGASQTVQTLPPVGRAAAAASLPVVASTEDKAVSDAQAASLVSILAKISADPATQTTLQQVLDELGDQTTLLSTSEAYLPPQPVVASNDATVTRGTINLSAVSTDQTLQAAVSGQSTRVHRLFATVTGNASECLVTVKRGSTALGYFRIPTTGGVIDLAFSSYWHFKTNNNETFVISPSVSCNIAGWYDYAQSA